MELTCTVAVERLGLCATKLTYQNCSLLLGRNEFRDLNLKMNSNKHNAVYNVSSKNITVHKRFVKDGKASIGIPDSKIQLLLSNAPPNKLAMFIRTLLGKQANLDKENKINPKQRLLSNRTKAFQDISPLTEKDLNTLHNTNQQNSLNKTPTRVPSSKKRQSENATPVLQKKKLCIQRILNPIPLTHEQRQVLNAVLGGKNVFFTGSAGTGKSHLLKHIIGALPPDSTVATASTGVAACHIGGITLHSFAGIGSGKESIEQCIQQAQRKNIAQQWRKCACLVVDEISMIDKEYFDKLERVAREVRNNDKPFGGIQLVLCGDFLQLPPVSKSGQSTKFCFQSGAWDRCIHLNMELTEVKRQKDLKFIDVLQQIRLGRCPDNVTKILALTSEHDLDKNGVQATKLCTHKEHVDFVNESKLSDLPGKRFTFQASDSEPALAKFLSRHTPVDETLVLKIGTQVMLTKNLDVQRGLVNGARGVVEGFESPHDHPVVKFLCGVKQAIRYERWTVRAQGGVLMHRRQLPLKLAWAISIHKSQGMTLDCVEISLGNVFECGQAYVALSRARSLDGLRVLGFNRNCVRANSDVLQFYKELRTDRMLYQQSLDNYF